MNKLNEQLCIGMVPLSREEELEIGGGIGWLIPSLVAGLITSAIQNFGDIREGFSDGFHDVPPRY